MKNVVAFVLGGGRGTRLRPLTEFRSKPAVPLAGKYRLIDVPLSNSINSDINRIYLLTQFLSVSLHRHIRQTYKFDRFSGGFVEILAAQQTGAEANKDWYQGTADAVRKNLTYLDQPHIDHVLILSGDQLYRMDYREMLQTHIQNNADATIACLPVNREAARGFGIMRTDSGGRVQGFLEKPDDTVDVSDFHIQPEWLGNATPKGDRNLLASMGIYAFKRDVLVKALEVDYEDFGKDIFPAIVRSHHVQAHLFDDYWEDIGTIRAFYQANLDLTKPNAAFKLDMQEAPLFSRARFLPPARFDGAHINQSLIADGCRIGRGAKIENSVVGLRCVIGDNVTIKNSIVMGADFFPTDDEVASDVRDGRPSIGIGDGSVIDGVIVDKNCRLGRNVHIANRQEDKTEDTDISEFCVIREGIPVIVKNAVLPDGWRLKPDSIAT